MISELKYRLKFFFESSFIQEKNHNLEKICQFMNGSNFDQKLYEDSGIVVVKNLLEQHQIDKWRKVIIDEIKAPKFIKEHKKKKYWIGNMSNISSGIEIVSSSEILSLVNQIIGEERIFVGHDSVSINYSVPGLHDDQNTHRELFGDSVYENFKTTRVLFNLNSFSSLPQRFGFVPGSHQRMDGKINYSKAKKNIEWIEVSHGTVIFFDPRLVHSASEINQDKYMIVLTYDKENDYVKKIYEHTYHNRGQGVGPKAEAFWSKLEDFNLKPSFIDY